MARTSDRHGEELYELAVEFLAETANAVLVLDHATGEQLWIPLSQVEEIRRDTPKLGVVVMTAWIAKKKGLI